MNVFVLTSGRTGSMSFINACKHITNYSCGHESRTSHFEKDKFNYPLDHIESDNRLSWFLGDLDKKYGNDAIYVVLKREMEPTAKSLFKRLKTPTSIIKSFSSGILKTPTYKLKNNQLEEVSRLYYTSLYANIELFLKDKTQKMEIDLEDIDNGFEKFWKLIGAEGRFDSALETLKTPINTSLNSSFNLTYSLKSFIRSQAFYLFRKL